MKSIVSLTYYNGKGFKGNCTKKNSVRQHKHDLVYSKFDLL